MSQCCWCVCVFTGQRSQSKCVKSMTLHSDHLLDYSLFSFWCILSKCDENVFLKQWFWSLCESCQWNVFETFVVAQPVVLFKQTSCCCAFAFRLTRGLTLTLIQLCVKYSTFITCCYETFKLSLIFAKTSAGCSVNVSFTGQKRQKLKRWDLIWDWNQQTETLSFSLSQFQLMSAFGKLSLTESIPTW